MLKTLATLLCICLTGSAYAKLGENAPALIKRFGKTYTIDNLKIGQRYRFRSENVSLDAIVVDGISMAETYFSDHPLGPQGEPPNEIVRAILRTNAPQVRWVEIEAAPLRADYAIRSSDYKYIATLRYSGPQPEKVTWTMTVAVASLITQLPGSTSNPENASPPAKPGASLLPAFTPGNPQHLDRAIEEAKRKERETAIAEFTKAIEKNPNDADALGERGYTYSLLGNYEKAVADYEAALKIRPGDHKTEMRLKSARAMVALWAAPAPSSTATPRRSASAFAPLVPAPTQRVGPGFFSEAVRIVGLIGTMIFYIVALANAFRRNTVQWMGTAVLAAILFGLVLMIFTRGLLERISPQSHGMAFNWPSRHKEVPSPLLTTPSAIEATPAPTPAVASTEATPTPVPIVAARIQRSVVLIAGMSSSGQVVETGTGFFISNEGHLITCWHVVAPAEIDHFRIKWNDGAECNVEGIFGFSPKNDLALLKTAVSAADFLRIRRNGIKPDTGTRILVFGNPGQLRGVWSEGAVSGFLLTGKDATRDSLRFDAPVAPGSSGSPVVDIEKGDVVGVASATGWILGNFAVPFYYLADLVDSLQKTTAISLADLRANLEKEKPLFKERVFDKERRGDLAEAAALCDEYSAQYAGEVWSTWEHAQISFASDDYNAASFYTAWLEPAKDPGDDLLCAIQFETGDALFSAPAQRAILKQTAELLRKDYDVEICAVQMRPDRQLNVRRKPDAKADVLYQFDSDEHVFAKQDRVRNSGGKEKVTWRKVLLLPTRNQIHGGEAWVNERYIAPLSISAN